MSLVLTGEVHDVCDIVLAHEVQDDVLVVDISDDERVVGRRGVLDVLHVGDGIESIDVDDAIFGIGFQPVIDERAADESAAAGDEQNARTDRID